MPKNLDARRDKRDELEQIQSRCVTAMEFMNERFPSEMFTDMIGIIRAAFERGDLRGMRMLDRDIREWAGGLSQNDQEELDGLLQQRVGMGMSGWKREMKTQIASILKRGTLRNEEDYRLLLQRADEIYADPAQRTELDRINALLATYHDK